MPDSLSLAGKVAIITGSGKENGIGAGIALSYAKAGARVVINYVSDTTAPRAEQTLATIEAAGGKGCVLAVQADASTTEGGNKIVDATLKGFGVDHIDILGEFPAGEIWKRFTLTVEVNNAGQGAGGPVLHTDSDTIERVFRINAIGPIYLMQAVVPHMPRGGRIINIGTVASKTGTSMIPLYAASKAAMATLSFAMAEEVRSIPNSLTPGPG